jgi:hypothetical protein
MPTFNVIFTGDTMYDQSDMESYAKGAGGVVFEDVNRAVTNYRQGGGLEVLLVQGSWGVGRKPSRKTLDAMKYGSEVTIVSDEIFMARDGIKESKRRLDEEAAVNAPSTPRPRPAALALALVTLTPCSRAVPTPCPVPPAPQKGAKKADPSKKPKEPKEPKKKIKATGGSSTDIETNQEVLLGIEPEFDMPPGKTKEDLQNIIMKYKSDSFMPLQEAPVEVKRDFRDATIPFDKIITTLVLILTVSKVDNVTIISTGMESFTNIAHELRWRHTYVGASMRTKLVGEVVLDRSISTKGTMTRRGTPSPHPAPHHSDCLMPLTCHRRTQKNVALHWPQHSPAGLAATNDDFRGGFHAQGR